MQQVLRLVFTDVAAKKSGAEAKERYERRSETEKARILAAYTAERVFGTSSKERDEYLDGKSFYELVRELGKIREKNKSQ